MKLDQIAIGFFVFALFFLVGSYAIVDINLTYGTTLDTSRFQKTFAAINQTYNISADSRAQLEGEDAQDLTQDSLFGKAYTTASKIKSTLGIFSAIVSDAGAYFGIPSYMIGIAIAIFSVMIIFYLVYFLMGVIYR